MNSTLGTKVPLRSLTGARFFAALSVIVAHYAVGRQIFGGRAGRFLDNGPSGVTFFYILSGFILTYNYAGRSADGRLKWRSFMQIRFARVYPIYLVGLILGTIVWLESQRFTLVTFAGFLLNVSMLHDFVPFRSAHGFNSPSWSVSCEMFFYVIFPFLLPVLARVKRPLSAAFVFFAVESLLYGLSFMIIKLICHSCTQGVLITEVDLAAYRQPLVRVFEFAIGILLGLFFLRRRFAIPDICTWGALVLGTGIMAFIPYTEISSIGWGFRAFLLFIPVSAMLILGLGEGRTMLSRFLACAWLVELGDASYSLYIIHAPLREVLLTVPVLAHLPFVCIGITILVSLGSYRWIEVPARNWIRGLGAAKV
jgi:peptidoglycan/LPS O-acetylase OafA/YrhL